MSDSKRDIETIFDAARQLATTEEREAYLRMACGDDEALRSRIGEMLAVEADARDFLKTDEHAVDAIRKGDSLVKTVAESDLSLSEGPGTVIGRYKLLQQIGEGGFGVVYMARQDKPVTRDVALKIIKLGMDTNQVVGRFEAERQALAMMDHPNIAKVLDAGSTDSGRPYFCMELVKGVAITTYCDNNNLTTRERLELFVPVCQALHHAHQKGIIHRDIKPSNVMVTLHDGRPVPKVIDFGIAKATQHRLTEKTIFTQYAQLIGTPAYMSPEQAEMSGLDVDTRTDVYSLGVLLYELLTGRPPFDPKELLEKGYDEMRRIVRSVDPPKPSTRLSTLKDDELTSVAQHRKLQPDKLGRVVRGELDWIVMKALEKDRMLRYDSSFNFADDVSRYLRDEPVAAAAPSAIYRFRKYARRNKSTLAIAASFVLLLIGATVVSSWQAVRATRAEHMARAEAEVSANVKDYLISGLISSASPYDLAGANKDTTVKEFLDKAEKEIEERFADQPLVEADLRHLLGEAHIVMQEHVDAERHFTRALALRTKFLGRVNEKTIDTLQWLGRTVRNARRHKEADNLLSEAVSLSELYLGPAHELTLWSQLSWARNKAYEFGFDEEIRIETERVLATARQHLSETNDIVRNALLDLGSIHVESGELKRGEAMLRELLGLSRRALPPFHGDLVNVLFGLGEALMRQGRFEESLHFCQEGLEMIVRQMGTDSLQFQFYKCMVADLYLSMGEFERAETMLTESVKGLESLGGRDGFYTRVALDPLARLYAMTARFQEAQDIFEETRRIFESTHDLESRPYVQALQGLVFLEVQRGEFSEALGSAHALPTPGFEASSKFAVLELFVQGAAASTGFRDLMLSKVGRESPEELQFLLRADCLSSEPRMLAIENPILQDVMSEAESLLPENWEALKPKTYIGLGMGAYRMGEYARTVAYLEQVISVSPWLQSQKQFFLAMAQHELGESIEADQALASGQMLMDGAFNPMKSPLGLDWVEALAAEIARKEAVLTVRSQ